MSGTPELTPDERAAVRAYLQRCDVRLSTIHRVCTALLSGAGLLVVFPAVARDSVVGVVHALLRGPVSPADGFLVVAVVAALVVPVVALLYLLRDLTQFYFHANHVSLGDRETFTPRFTLTALRLPADELGPSASHRLEDARHRGSAVELLVPANDGARADLDRRLALYGLDHQLDRGVDDRARADALFALASSHPRDLLEEVAKVEHGLARHVLRIQTIVLRYVKALLALITTAMAVFAAASVVDGETVLASVDDAWLAGVLLVWAPVVVAAVTAPVRWLERQLRSEGASATAIASDPDLTSVEITTVRIALLGAAAAAAAMVSALADEATSVTARGAGTLVVVGIVIVLALQLHRWAGRDLRHRLLGTEPARDRAPDVDA